MPWQQWPLSVRERIRDFGVLRATKIVANDNGVEFGSDGIGIEERDGGRVDARFTQVTADGNGDNGIDIKEDENEEDAEEESDSGDLLVRMTQVSTSSNLDYGLNIEEFSDGNLDFQATSLRTNDNGGDGSQVQEEGAGDNDTRFVLTAADRKATKAGRSRKPTRASSSHAS